MFSPENLPVDILPPILDNLTDRRDLHSAALVSWAFNRAAIPFLYVRLDARLIRHSNRDIVLHPATTLLQLPTRTQYVRHIRETGAVHGSPSSSVLRVTVNALAALRLCTKLRSFSWVDDNFLPDGVLLSFLEVLQTLPIEELTIRTFGSLTEEVWDRLKEFTRLRKVAIWCLEGPPRVLQGWSETLGSTLTHLELGRCAGVPATILISVLSQLPLLTDLRLKGAPSTAIPIILSCLPNLCVLDTDYITTGIGSARIPTKPLPLLRSLTVRTSSIDAQGPRQLWPWIMQLVPRSSLETFTLNAFSVNGQTSIPRAFLLDLANLHKDTMKHFLVGITQLTLTDVACLCTVFPLLQSLSCSVATPDAAYISRAIIDAHNLRALQLLVDWMPPELTGNNDTSIDKAFIYSPGNFTLENALAMMLRSNSCLRLISIDRSVYKVSITRISNVGMISTEQWSWDARQGRWVQVWEDGDWRLKFDVVHDVSEDKRAKWV